jgi:segregation and condensation protein B
MAENGLVHIVEGALMAAGEPLSVQRLLGLFDEVERPEKEDVLAALAEIEERCHDRGFELVEVASGYRFQVRQNLAPWVGRLWQERPQKYSRALLETLSLIAYRQPITRGEIEEIRGVAVSSNIVKTLQERDWVRVVGHRDVPGRPAMYATTRQFLDYFNLQSLEQLPPLAEIKELDNLSGALPLEDEGVEDEGVEDESVEHEGSDASGVEGSSSGEISEASGSVPESDEEVFPTDGLNASPNNASPNNASSNAMPTEIQQAAQRPESTPDNVNDVQIAQEHTDKTID